MFYQTRIFPKFSPNLSKFCQMRMNSLLFRFLPFSISRWYLATLGKLYYFFNRKEKEFIGRTVTEVFRRKVKGESLRTLIKQAFRGIFDHYHEKLLIAYSRFHGLERFLRNRIRTIGDDSLKEALRVGKGVILVTGHFGAVEFLPGVMALNGYPASIICRFQTQRLRNSLIERAEKVNLNIIDADRGNIFLAATRALKQGRILITECDEFDEWRVTNQKQLRFLGFKLGYDRTLDILRKRSGAPVVTALLKRENQRKYSLNFTPIINPNPSGDMAVGEQCLKVLEKAIQTSPEQWYQWKKFGKIIESQFKEATHEHPESGYLAPKAAVPVPLHA